MASVCQKPKELDIPWPTGLGRKADLWQEEQLQGWLRGVGPWAWLAGIGVIITG